MESNSNITYKVRVTLAIGLPNRTWVDKEVVIEAPAGFDDMDDYPLAERAFDHLLQHESRYLDGLMPTFWVVQHYEVLD
jgi:hypothetical protein